MKSPTFLILLCSLLIGPLAVAQKAETNPLKQKEASLRMQLAEMQASETLALDKLEDISEEDRQILEMEEEETAIAGLELLYQLSDNLLQQEEAGLDTTDLRDYIVRRMDAVPELVLRAMERNKDSLEKLRQEKDDASPSELGIIEEQIGVIENSNSRLFEIATLHIEKLQQLGVETADLRKRVDDVMRFRARLLAGRLKKLQADRTILNNRVSANPDDADLSLRLGAIQVAIDHNVQSLETIVRLMEQRGMDTTAYKTILIKSTGDLSRGFDLGVFWRIVQNGWKSLMVWIHEQLPGVMTKLMVFVVFLFLFHLLGRLLQKGISRAVESSRINISRLLGRMIANTSYRIVLFLGLLMALAQIGFSLTPLLAGLGVAGFIVGFALQDTLGNFASGMMILFYRPFDENDFIEAAGVRGRVNKMSLVSTTILTIDNQTLVVPNNKIWGDVICNLTDQEMRRVDLVFGVSYDSDIPKVERILNEVVAEYDKVLDEPEPIIRVHELADSSVNFILRPWVKTEDYWETYWYLIREVKMRFDKEGVVIPFPQRDVHHYHPEGREPGNPGTADKA